MGKITLIIFIISTVVVLSCSNLKSSSERVISNDGQELVDTVSFIKDSVRIIYSYVKIDDKKILKSVVREQKVYDSVLKKYLFLPFQETYFNKDGSFRAIYNTKDRKVTEDEKLGNVILYDQDQFILDSNTDQVKILRITNDFSTVIDIMRYQEFLYDMNDTGPNGEVIYDFSDSDSTGVKFK